MKSYLFSRTKIVTICLLFLGLMGCATSPPTRFYVLSPLPATETGTQVKGDDRCVAIGIDSVKVPEYLDRPQIVTRLSPNTLQLAEFDKWAEPLEANFTRVLTKNLSGLLCTEHIAVFPWKGSTPIDYQVSVEVLRLDGRLGEGISLTARWTIFGKDGQELLLTEESSFTERTGSGDYEALVSAESRAIANLSRHIADAIKALSRGGRDQ